MSATLQIIIGVATAVLTLTGALAGSWLGARRERDHWLRQERLTAYTKFIDSVLIFKRRSDEDDALEPAAMRSAKTPVVVLGPESVAAAASELETAAWEEAIGGPASNRYQSAMDAFGKATRDAMK